MLTRAQHGREKYLPPPPLPILLWRQVKMFPSVPSDPRCSGKGLLRVPDSLEMVVLSKNDVLGVNRKMFPHVSEMRPYMFPYILTSSCDDLGVNV